MIVKIKKLHPDAVIPSYAKLGDAGLDLTAVRYEISYSFTDKPTQIVYYTGISVEIPEGFVGLVFPRSSIYRKDLILSNSVGIIDSGYRGEIQAIFNVLDYDNGVFYDPGDRIAQLVIMPRPFIEVEQVTELSPTERGANGFGSSGK